MILWLALFACSSAEFNVTPAELDFGSVDFQQDLPDAGYSAQSLTLVNSGEKTLIPRITEFDSDRLRLSAMLEGSDPPTLFPLDPGASVTLEVGVIGYELGERDTVVEGRIRIEAEPADPVNVGWSFTPIRDLDTGDADGT